MNARALRYTQCQSDEGSEANGCQKKRKSSPPSSPVLKTQESDGGATTSQRWNDQTCPLNPLSQTPSA